MVISKENLRIIEKKSFQLYGKRKSKLLIEKINELLAKYKTKISFDLKKIRFLDERDIVLITYGDNIKIPKTKPLKSLLILIDKYLRNTINIIHLLPFYPYSSDDGFSVIDYKKVNPILGTWKDISEINQKCNLMIDLVANHISAQSEVFKEYLKGNKDYNNFFIKFNNIPDSSSVTRARDHPLFSLFSKNDKKVYLWTTFSSDQIDFNYANENVLLTIIDILLFYCSKNPRLVRLDAIGHIWKCLSTSCINLKAVHDIIQIMRAVVNEISPKILLVAEANVIYKKNLKYFGDGYNEAQLVYNFALPFLVLHTFYTGNALRLLEYINNIGELPGRATFFNILATHDGIGVVPVKNILNGKEIKNVLENVIQRGGYVSYKDARNGTKKPYELNITYYSAIADSAITLEENIQKFITSQAIILSLRGIPGIYIHSLFGTVNDLNSVIRTGQKRSINRKKLSYTRIEELLADKNSREYRVFNELIRLINLRKSEIAFHPNGNQRIIFIKKEIFSLLRISPDKKVKIITLINVTNKYQKVHLDVNEFLIHAKRYHDIVSGEIINRRLIMLTPYQIMWLKLL